MVLSDEKGMALVGVIMVVLIFSSLGAAMLSIAERESMIARDEEAALQALYAAEGGLRKVIMELKNNPEVDVGEICEDYTNYRVGQAKIENISYEESENYLDVTATGTAKNARKTLVTRISKLPDSGVKVIFWKELSSIY